MSGERSNKASSMAEYLRHSGRPLVLYGMGKIGIRAYRKIKSLGIQIDAIIDGDPSKQHTFVEALKILSPREAIREYEDAVCMITVGQKGLVSQIEDIFYADGAHWDMVAYAPSWFHDLRLPFVVFGGNRLAKAVRQQLATDKLNFRGYLLLDGEGTANFSGEKAISLRALAESKELVNIILCEKKKEREVVWQLQRNNLTENCFQGYDPIFGFFKRCKYEPESVLIRNLLYPHLCALNKIYQGFADHASRRLFYAVCLAFFQATHTLSIHSYFDIAREKRRWQHELLPDGGIKFACPAKNIKAFLKFIIFLDRLTADVCCHDIKLAQLDTAIQAMFSRERGG